MPPTNKPARARAISNNDVVFLAWELDERIPGCLGFSISRTDSKGKTTVLPAWVGFTGQSNPNWTAKTTAEWPIQKFTWRDLTAAHGETYTYSIVPMGGTIVPGKDLDKIGEALMTNSVSVSAKRGDFSAYFNRGILSTQMVAHQIQQRANGTPNVTELRGRIDQPGDPLRNRLSGELREAMLGLFARAVQEDLHLYGALYELTDTELEQKLLEHKDRVHLLLSNTGVDDAENTPARQALHEAGVDITDHMTGNGHIGHNKFVVLAKRPSADGTRGAGVAVWTGSTNWTETGLCTQNNNGLLIESADLAEHYLAFWDRLKVDGGEQGQALRDKNSASVQSQADQGKTDITLWFSPNTAQKNKSAGSTTPGDMADVFSAMDKAKQAILFLVFMPGNPSVVDHVGDVQSENPNLFVHGAATDPNAVNSYETHLFHRSGSQSSTDVVAVAAVDDQFGYWEKEMLKLPGAHAVIHDKIVVIDPFSDDCVVITGSHNLGYRASYNNDENLLIIRGNKELAAAYATHVMDVYDHYRWRYQLQTKGHAAWQGLQVTDAWQNKYYLSTSLARKEQDFWLGKMQAMSSRG